MKEYNGEKYIVSFTSFGKRLDLCLKMIYATMKLQTYKDFHLVLTVYEGDRKNIGKNLQKMMDLGFLEVIFAPIDLGPHLKYYYVMKKYFDKPIITLDDDRVYEAHTIERLVKKYESLSYKSVVSNCAIKMGVKGSKVTPYTRWIPNRLPPNGKSYIAMAEGFAGILYPPCCFDNLDTDEYVSGIQSCKYDDDLYLKVQEIENKVPVTQSDFRLNGAEKENIPEMQRYSLHLNVNKGDVNRNKLCLKFSDRLMKGFALEKNK